MLTRVLLLLVSISLFSSCFNDELIHNADNSGSELSNEAANSKNESKNNSPVEVIGAFSNRESNGEHEWGYEVEIWSNEGNLVGMFTGSAGTRLVGDPPTGVLKDVEYNFDTGIISFRATLPDNDHVFEGMLSKKTLSGRLFNISERSLGQRCDEAKKLALLRSQKFSDEMEEFQTLDAWTERINQLLKRRGVKETIQ